MRIIGRKNPVVRTITQTKTIQVQPDMKKFVAKDELAEILAQRYVAICDDIEPYIGGTTNRHYVDRQLGKLDEIVDIIHAVTGKDRIVLVYQLDKRVHEERQAAKEAARAEVEAADADEILVLDAEKLAVSV